MRAIIKSIAPGVPFFAPVHILIVSVIVIPSLYVAWLSLNASTFGQTPTFVGFANYVRVLTDPGFLRGLGNTVVIVVFAVHLELAIGLGMALLFATGLPFRRLLLVVVLAPYAVSEVIAVAMWRFLFDPDVGPITWPSRHSAFHARLVLRAVACARHDRAADDLAAPALHVRHPVRRKAGYS